jgi:flavin reductase (DIM6/NTAB) family NADH-FMN oxidoreductase RutF
MKSSSKPSLDKNLESVDTSIVYRLFNPQVPVIACTKSGREVAAMPANSCSSVSDSPSMVCIAIRKGLRTNRVLRSSSRFSINWINFEPKKSREIVNELAKKTESTRVASDKLKEHGIAYKILSGTPVLSIACAFALCKAERRISTGDHDLFIGRVTSAYAIRDFTEDGYWRFRDYKPVLYVGSIRAEPLVSI